MDMKRVIWMPRHAGKSVFVMEQVKQRVADRMKNPWDYLQEIVRYDRGPEHQEEWMTNRLQARWPGNYKVVKDIDYQWQAIEYKIVFDSPEDETWARLQWTY